MIDSVRAANAKSRTDGRWFFLRVRPYLTLDNKVDGAVLVPVDINDLKRSEARIASAREYAENIIGTMREPLVVLDTDLRVESVNRAFYRTFGMTPAEVTGQTIYELGNRQWDIPRLRALLEEVLPLGNSFDEFEVTHDFPALGRRTMLLNGRRLRDGVDHSARILLGFQDITERKRAEEALRDGEARLKLALDVSKMGTFTWFVETDRGEPDDQMRALFGLLPGATLTLREALASLIHHDDRAAYAEAVAQATDPAGSGLLRTDIRVVRRDGSVRWLEETAVRSSRASRERATRMSGVAIDITERRKTELRAGAKPTGARTSSSRCSPTNCAIRWRRSATALELLRLAGDTASRSQRRRSMMERQVGAHGAPGRRPARRLADHAAARSSCARSRSTLATSCSAAIEASAAAIDASAASRSTSRCPTSRCRSMPIRTRLAQVFSNLLHQRAKYTDSGGRIGLVRDVERRRATRAVVIDVRDTGIGIPADMLPRDLRPVRAGRPALERSQAAWASA